MSESENLETFQGPTTTGEQRKKNIQDEIQKALKTSENIDKIIKKIYKTVELTKMNATDKFMSFIEPKKNLDDISQFYDIFIDSSEKIKELKNINVKLTNIEQVIVNLDNCNLLWDIKDNLERYEKVLIVKRLLEANNDFLNYFMSNIENQFLKNIWEVQDTLKMSKIAKFLLEKRDNKEFLSKYSSELFNKVSCKIIFDKTKLLENTNNIDNYLYTINVYNIKVLGEKIGRNINLGLNKILVINLTKMISDNLQSIERTEKLEDVPLLMNLNYNLKHNDEKTIKEVESLFVFKDAINKIICNIFITYCDNVERLDKPNKYCDVERMALDLNRALDSMNKYKILTNVWIRNYGPMFKIKNLDECNRFFTYMLIQKITKFSETLPDLKKFIYLINNFYTLQNYIESDLKNRIPEYTDSIINTFKAELQKRNKDKLTSFIDSNLIAFKSYYLPEEIRTKVVLQIKKYIWEEIAKKEYTGNIDNLNNSINDMFIGQ